MTDAAIILLSALGPISVCLALVIMGMLSQRLGSVIKMPAYYRWFFVAAGLTGVSAAARLLAVSEITDTLALVCTLTFALGVTLGVVVAWRYWSWLFGERSN